MEILENGKEYIGRRTIFTEIFKSLICINPHYNATSTLCLDMHEPRKKNRDLTSANQAIIAKNSESFRKLAAATATSSLEQPHNWTTEEGAELAQLDSGLEEIQSNSDRAEAEARLLRDLSTLFLSRYAPGLPAQTVNENDWYRRYIGLLSRNSQRQIDILKIEEQAN